MWFSDGGPMMYGVLLAGVASLALAVLHAVRQSRRSLLTVGVAMGLVLSIGMVAHRIRVSESLRDVAMAAPEDAEAIREVALREARAPLVLAAALGGACCAVVAPVEFTRRRRRAAR